MGSVSYFSEDCDFQLLKPQQITSWIQSVFNNFNQSFEEVNYIFCSDEYLLSINKQYLQHNFYTDIITFENHEEGEPISTDIFISIDRIKENAQEYNTSFDQELKRVMVHGLLHLFGFTDKTKEEKEVMSAKEDYCLSLYPK